MTNRPSFKKNLQKNATNEVYKNGDNGDADRPQITTEKEILNVNHVNHVTPAQRCSTNPSCNAANTVDADGTVRDIAGSLSAKERERCKQTSLTDEQVNIFYQVFNELENVSNLNPGSFSSDDKGTIGREELKSCLVSVGKFTENDADWLVKEMQRIGNIKKVAFDTFRRAS